MFLRRPRRFDAGLPLLPMAPALVSAVGLAAAVAVTFIGVQDLRRASDDGASLRATVLASTLAARLRVTGSEDRAEVVQHAGRVSGADVLLIDQQGSILVDGSIGAPGRDALVSCLLRGSGPLETRLGRTFFAARPLGSPLDHLAVIAFVSAPSTPSQVRVLMRAVATLAAMLVGAAGVVAYVFAKDTRDDVTFVRRRIEALANPDTDPAGELIPVRALDQVGVLTAAFNLLVSRFAAAERSHRQDLHAASALDNERSVFLAALSHELRTPLNAILGFTDVLLSEVDGPLDESTREDLEVIRSSASHLRALIDDILDLSALESGGLKLQRRPVDVYLLAEEIVRENGPTARAKNLQLTLSGDSPSVAHGDPRRLRQVLGNLIGNAVKFTSRGGVAVQITREDPFVVISTADTGPGIAEKERAAIFEEYQQAGDDTARRGGTGLGLAITRRLVSMHGGTIELESALGQGSRFIVRLPAAATRGIS